MSESLLRRAEVERRVGLKRTAIYDRVSKGTFPAPIKDEDEGHAVWWLASEIDAWIAKKAAGTRVGRNVGTISTGKEKAA